MNQDLKCFIKLHKYEVYKELDVYNDRNEIVGTAIILRCSNCGTIKVKYVYTKNNSINF